MYKNDIALGEQNLQSASLADNDVIDVHADQRSTEGFAGDGVDQHWLLAEIFIELGRLASPDASWLLLIAHCTPRFARGGLASQPGSGQRR